MKLVFTVHARWLAWSAEHHVNHYAFSETEQAEEWEEASRRNMPLFLLTHYAWTDLMAMIMGRESSETPSFLIQQKQKEASQGEDDMEDSDNVLPIHDKLTKVRISHDIAMDRITTKGIVARHSTQQDIQAAIDDHQQRFGGGGVERRPSARALATEAARLRHLSRAHTTARTTTTAAQENDQQAQPAYGSATAVAKLSQLTRANTALPDKKSTVRHSLSRANSFRRTFQDPDEPQGTQQKAA